MSLEEAIKENTEAVKKLTGAIEKQLDGQADAMKALELLFKDGKQAEPKKPAEPVKTEAPKQKPVKVVEPEPLHIEPILEAEPVEDTESTQLTYEGDVLPAFRECVITKGRERGAAILKHYNMTLLTADQLPAEKYGEFINACRA